MRKLMKRVPRCYGPRQGGGVYAYESLQFVNRDRYMAGNGQPWTVPAYQMDFGGTARDTGVAVGGGKVPLISASTPGLGAVEVRQAIAR